MNRSFNSLCHQESMEESARERESKSENGEKKHTHEQN